MLGGPYNDPVEKILPTFGNLLSAKTVVGADQLSYCQKNAFNLSLYSDTENTWDLYVSVYVDDVTMTSFEPKIIYVPNNKPLELVANGGIWKLFKGSYDTSVTGYPIFITSNINGSCNYRVWTTSEQRLTSLPHAYIAYTTSSTDATSALPVTGVSNYVVAHLDGLPQDIEYEFAVDVVIGTNISSGISEPRNCLFDSNLISITCQDSGDYGRIHIRINSESSFEEVLPLICVDPEDVARQDVVNEESFRLTRFHHDDLTSNNEFSNDDTITCSTKENLGLDPNGPRTFAVAFANYGSLVNILKNQILGTKVFIDVLIDYDAAYDFNNYLSIGYNKDSSTDVKVRIFKK